MKISDHQKMPDMEGQIKQSSVNKSNALNESKPPDKVEKEHSVVNSTDNVHLSSKARDIQVAQKTLETTPEVREEKVEELKGKIASGSYNVKGEAIADGIIKASLVDKSV